MMPDDIVDERKQTSRMEAIEYIACLLEDIVTLAAPQPDLQFLLRMAHLEAKQVVAADRTGQAGAKNRVSSEVH